MIAEAKTFNSINFEEILRQKMRPGPRQPLDQKPRRYHFIYQILLGAYKVNNKNTRKNVF